MSDRHTVVAHGSNLRRALKLEAAQNGLLGRQITSFEELACRLAGGFTHPINYERLRTATAVRVSASAIPPADVDPPLTATQSTTGR